jgi:hypothetical protein
MTEQAAPELTAEAEPIVADPIASDQASSTANAAEQPRAMTNLDLKVGFLVAAAAGLLIFVVAAGSGAAFMGSTMDQPRRLQTGRPSTILDFSPFFQNAKCLGSWKSNVFTSRLTTEEEMKESDFDGLLSEFKEKNTFHRKSWEYVFLLKIMRASGLFNGGPKKAIGFAVGHEPTVSYLASKGVSVVATDLPPDEAGPKGWLHTNQNMADTLAAINARNIATMEQMEQFVSKEWVDMNSIERSKVWQEGLGSYDFMWSICSIEHVGSIRQGLSFMVKSLQLLKPGGTAVHTTEFNLKSLESTLDNGNTVLYRKMDVDALRKCVINKGYSMPPICYDMGTGPLDHTVDMPPFSHDNHLRLQLEPFVATCVGFAIHKPVDFKDTGYDCEPLFDTYGGGSELSLLIDAMLGTKNKASTQYVPSTSSNANILSFNIYFAGCLSGLAVGVGAPRILQAFRHGGLNRQNGAPAHKI